jgi:hypothetical protein
MTINTTKISSTPTGIQQYEQIFTSSGTWTKPAGVKTVEVTCIGGGGGAYSQSYPGAGGGYIKRIVNVSSLPTSNSVIVGAGGLSTTTAGAVGIGGTSSFANLVYAYGGGAYTSRYTNYSAYAFTQDSGLAESVQHNVGGIANLSWREQYYTSMQGTSQPIVGGNFQTGNNKIAYGNGIYVAASGSTGVYYSTDGTTWSYASGVLSQATYQIAYGNGYFVAVPGSGIATTSAYYSTNGTTWTLMTLPTSQAWTGVAFGNGVFVAYANALTPAAYSTNGTTWTTQTLPTAAGPTMAYVNGYFITQALRSTNGTTWTATSMPITPTYISYGNSVYIAQASGATNTYYTSTDGTTWTGRTFSPGGNNIDTTSTSIGNIVFIYDRFVLTSTRGGLGVTYYVYGYTHYWTSVDGINWVFVKSKWNNASSQMNASYAMHSIEDAVAGPVSGQYFAVLHGINVENASGSYNYGSVIKLSTYFQGGFAGSIKQNATNTSGKANVWVDLTPYFSAPGAFGRADQLRSYEYQTNISPSGSGYYLRGPGTPEGWCMGGRSMGAPGSHAPDMGRNATANNYGCGADAPYTSYGYVPGGQGLVILRWWQ